MHSQYINILKSLFVWMVVNAALDWRTGGAEESTVGPLKYFGTVNGRAFYHGKEKLSWIDSMRTCILAGRRMKLLQFDTDNQIDDFASLLPSMKETDEGGIQIWTAGLSSKTNKDILWSGRDVYVSATNLTGEKYHLADTIGGGGCIMIKALQRPFKKTPSMTKFLNAACKSKADFFCFTSQETDVKPMLKQHRIFIRKVDTNDLPEQVDAGSSELQKAKRDPCIIKNPSKIDIFKEEGLSTEEMIILVKLGHKHAFHAAQDDKIGEFLDESDFENLSLKESIIDLFFKIVKRIFPNRYDQYAFLNIARRIIFLYYKWNNKGFPGSLDKAKWKRYRQDLIACFNILTPLTYRFSHEKIIRVSGQTVNLNGVGIYQENDIFLETLWFSFSTTLGVCTTSVNRTQPIFWMQQFFFDFDRDFLSAFKEIWSTGMVGSGNLEVTQMDLANQIFFGDMNYLLKQNNLALLSKAAHKINELDRLMIVRPL